jgi:hypothetical protein
MGANSPPRRPLAIGALAPDRSTRPDCHYRSHCPPSVTPEPDGVGSVSPTPRLAVAPTTPEGFHAVIAQLALRVIDANGPF